MDIHSWLKILIWIRNATQQKYGFNLGWYASWDLNCFNLGWYASWVLNCFNLGWYASWDLNCSKNGLILVDMLSEISIVLI